jgi:uridine phosphorylase
MSDVPAPTFPNLAGKHAHASIITPKSFLEYLRSVGEVPSVPPTIILSYSRQLIAQLVEAGRAEDPTRVSFATIHVVADTDRQVGVASGFGIGAPTAAVVMEELAALGAHSFITMGVVGWSIHSSCDIGRIVLCTSAVRDEGVSYHYLAPAKFSYPHEELTRRVRNQLLARSIDFAEGPTWTVDAPYRETVEEARHYQSEGVLTVEMEAAAVFAVAEVRAVAAAGAFVISDSLSELTWNPRFGVPEVVEGTHTLFSICVEALQEKAA